MVGSLRGGRVQRVAGPTALVSGGGPRLAVGLHRDLLEVRAAGEGDDDVDGPVRGVRQGGRHLGVQTGEVCRRATGPGVSLARVGEAVLKSHDLVGHDQSLGVQRLVGAV